MFTMLKNTSAAILVSILNLKIQSFSTVKNEGPEGQRPSLHVCSQLLTTLFTPQSQLARYQMPLSTCRHFCGDEARSREWKHSAWLKADRLWRKALFLHRAVVPRNSYKVWSSLAINNSIKNFALSFELMNCADFKSWTLGLNSWEPYRASHVLLSELLQSMNFKSHKVR